MELTANHSITQIVEVVSDFEKRAKLIKHLDQISRENAKVLIFVGTKRVADDITKYLRQDGWPALAIHGDKEQYVSTRELISHKDANQVIRRERDWVLSEFKAGRSPILIATDVASRGLGMFLSLCKRYDRMLQRDDGYSHWCEYLGRLRRRRRLPRCSFRSWVRRRGKTGEDLKSAHRTSADSLLINAQLPLTHRLNPTACTRSWVHRGMCG